MRRNPAWDGTNVGRFKSPYRLRIAQVKSGRDATNESSFARIRGAIHPALPLPLLHIFFPSTELRQLLHHPAPRFVASQSDVPLTAPPACPTDESVRFGLSTSIPGPSHVWLRDGRTREVDVLQEWGLPSLPRGRKAPSETDVGVAHGHPFQAASVQGARYVRSGMAESASDVLPRAASGLQPRGGRELGSLAVWSASSAKSGNGVSCARDGCTDTYWQSDGAQPHTVTAQFARRVSVQCVSLHADFRRDESYTPLQVAVRVGNASWDLREVVRVEMAEPQGWCTVSLTADPRRYVRAFVLQVVVLANHQNGRDTHLRQVHVYGPAMEANEAAWTRAGVASASIRHSCAILR